MSWRRRIVEGGYLTRVAAVLVLSALLKFDFSEEVLDDVFPTALMSLGLFFLLPVFFFGIRKLYKRKLTKPKHCVKFLGKFFGVVIPILVYLYVIRVKVGLYWSEALAQKW